MKCIHNSSGITLVEVLIAASILVVFMLGGFVVYSSMFTSVANGTDQLKAYYLMEEGVEAIKTLRDDSWTDNIASLVSQTTYYLEWDGSQWLVTTNVQNIDDIGRSFIVEDVYRDGNDDIAPSGTLDSDTKKLTVTVSWSERGTSTPQTQSVETYITNLFGN